MRTKNPVGVERRLLTLQWQVNFLFAVVLLSTDPVWWIHILAFLMLVWSGVTLVVLFFTGRGDI